MAHCWQFTSLTLQGVKNGGIPTGTPYVVFASPVKKYLRPCFYSQGKTVRTRASKFPLANWENRSARASKFALDKKPIAFAIKRLTQVTRMFSLGRAVHNAVMSKRDNFPNTILTFNGLGHVIVDHQRDIPDNARHNESEMTAFQRTDKAIAGFADAL